MPNDLISSIIGFYIDITDDIQRDVMQCILLENKGKEMGNKMVQMNVGE